MSSHEEVGVADPQPIQLARPRVALLASEATVAAIRRSWGPSLQRDFDLEPHSLLTRVLGTVTPGSHAAILLDLKAPDGPGLEGMARIHTLDPGAPLVVLSERPDPDAARRALRGGAQDFLVIADLSEQRLEHGLRAAIERQAILRERQTAMERLRELERFKTQFINTAAHELNSPLTPVKLQIHMLNTTFRQGLGKRHIESLQIVERNVDRLIALVGDVLEAARLQSNRLLVRKEPLELGKLLDEAAVTSNAAVQLAKLKLVVHNRPGVYVDADPDRITQVVNNLVTNAIKFTPQGGTITLRLEEDGNSAVVKVQDTGIGLRPEDFGRLFQPFSQTHEWVDGKKPGTGLGLYICQGIIEQHGGRIWVDSAGPHQGSTFCFALPMRDAPVLGAPTPQPMVTIKPKPVQKRGFWPIMYFKCPTCGSSDIDMRVLRNKYECRSCTDEWQ